MSFEVGDLVWGKKGQDAVWRVDHIRRYGSQYPNSPTQLVLVFVRALDPAKIWLPGRRQVVEPDVVEKIPAMLAIAVAVEDR